MRPKLLVPIFILAIMVISGCIQESSRTPDRSPVTCSPPYVQVGTGCCADRDNDGLCDSDANGGINGGGSGIQIESCNGEDLLIIKDRDCTISKFRALPMITFQSPSKVYLEVYYVNESGSRLVITNPDIIPDREYSLPIIYVTEKDIHTFMLRDNRTGECVYTTIDCRG